MLPPNDVRQAAQHRLWQKHRYEQWAAADDADNSDDDSWGKWTDPETSTGWEKLKAADSGPTKGSKMMSSGSTDTAHDDNKWADNWHDDSKWADKQGWHDDDNKWADNTGWYDDNKGAADKTQGWHGGNKWADNTGNKWADNTGWHGGNKWADNTGWHDDNKWADQQGWHDDDSKWADKQGWYDDNKDAADKTQGWHADDSKWADNTRWHDDNKDAADSDDEDAADSTRGLRGAWGTWNNPSSYPGALLMGDPEKPLLKPVAKLMPQAKNRYRNEPPAFVPTPPSGPPPASLLTHPIGQHTTHSSPPHDDCEPDDEPAEADDVGGNVPDEFDEPVIDAIIDELRARTVDANGFDETTRNEANRAYNEMTGKKCSRGTKRRGGRKDQRKRATAILSAGDNDGSDSDHEHRLVNRRAVRDIIESL